MEKENMTLLVNGKNAFPEIITCIESAKTSVEINMFIWRDDGIGNRIAQAVLTAADRGVKVFICVDRYGVVLEKCEECKRSFFHKEQSRIEKIKIAALELLYPENGRRGAVRDEYTPLYTRIISHPNITVSADEFRADHSKFYIIDDEILFLGGINIEDKENGCDISGRVYGDYMVKLRGSAYVAAFREKLATGKNAPLSVSFGINRKKTAGLFEMQSHYLALISGASTRLHITMAYFSPIKEFTDAIAAAHRRGVQVTLVIPEKANFQNNSNRRTVRKLLKATDGQIAVYLSPNMLHTKLVMNDRYISLGSTNITKKAFTQLDELNLIVPGTHSEFVQRLEASIRTDISQARRVENYREITYNRLFAFMESFLV